MPTVRVDNLHTFKNEFSRFGRRTNELYKQLNKKGCHYILERDMPDKSRVILAYESKDSKTSKYTIGLRRDGSMIQKTYERSEVIQPLTIIDRIQTITKTFLESTGEKVKEITKIINKILDDKTANFYCILQKIVLICFRGSIIWTM